MQGTEDIITNVADIDWDVHLAQRTQRMGSSVIRELLKLTMKPDIISFAGGLPAPEFFPVREIEEACHSVLQENSEVALQYSPTEGYGPLKQFLCEKMSKYSIQVEADNMLIVSGSQQGLDLVGKIMIDPGTKVVVSSPTYLGALQAWNAYEAEFLTLPLDEDGMCVEFLPQMLKEQPGIRMIYVLPTFHNPAGTTLPYERRLELVEIARKHDLIIIEDDPYGELRYEGEEITPIFRMAPERTIYLSTFSKTLTPGLRLAWVVAPKPLIGRLIQAKQGADLHTSTFVQMIANDVCQRGLLKTHVNRLCGIYKGRRDTMLDAMAEYMPESVTWTRPKGGLFLWANAPDQINTADFLHRATENKVAFVPGYAFYPAEAGGYHSMRLNFSNATEEKIVEGIGRLGTTMKAELRK